MIRSKYVKNGGSILQKDSPNTQTVTISIEEYLLKRKEMRQDFEEKDYFSEEESFPFFCNL